MRKVMNPGRRDELKYQFAARLRANMTEAERRLWAILRSRQVAGLRFRRQQPVGSYIVDFFCPALKLVVELDGDQHGSDEAMAYDVARTHWLEAQGYRVLRFANGIIFKDPASILDAIAHVAANREQHSS